MEHCYRSRTYYIAEGVCHMHYYFIIIIASYYYMWTFSEIL